MELDTRRTDSLEGAGGVRITTSGKYYLDYLARSFAYLDLVLQDTPFADRGIADHLCNEIAETDMRSRFHRVNTFVDYLRDQEQMELQTRGIRLSEHGFWGPFVPRIRSYVQKQEQLIHNRITRKKSRG